MKKMMSATMLLLAMSAAWCQPQKPPPAEDRWKHDSQIISEKANLDAATLAKMKPSFMSFYKSMDDMMKNKAGERPKKEEVEPLIKKRNDALKAVLKDNQFQSFIKIERELGPRPPDGKQGPPPQKN